MVIQRSDLITVHRNILALCAVFLIAKAAPPAAAAEPEEVRQYITNAMQSKPMSGDPYALDGKRIVFTDWFYIRPGNLLWENEAGDFLNTIEEHVENPVYGPWDAQLNRPSSPYGIELVAQQAERVGPVLQRENPWEEGYIIFKTVMKDGDIYRGWGKSNPGGDCYLESVDGYHWKRPVQRQREFEGSLENNLLKPGPEGTVFIDPVAPPEERYKSVRGPVLKFDAFKAFIEAHPDRWETRAVRGDWSNPRKIRAISGAISPDGVHWKHLGIFTVEHSDGMETGYYDLNLKKYVVYTRNWLVGTRSEDWTGDRHINTWMGELHGSGRRAIGRMESEVFGNFPLSEPVIVPVPGETSPSDVFYTSIHTTVPEAAGHHLMFPTIWDTRDDTSSIGLWTSHDGIHWNRLPGPPILETSNFGEWDGGCIFSFPDLIELPNGDFALPYKGYNLPHKYPRGTMELRAGYALWPKGRIVAVEAEEVGGFTTVGILPPGRTLKINAVSKRAGGIRVEIASIFDETVPGRSFADCDILQGDQFWSTVTWKGETDLGFEDGAGVVVRFKMDRAKLFGIEFE
jgi:hypothetical protein